MTDGDCDICSHPWTEHNSMGDCCHLDRRTATGYCAHHHHQ